VPARFAGPIAHAHDEFDEAIYVLSGRLLVTGADEPTEAVPGSMFVAARGQPPSTLTLRSFCGYITEPARGKRHGRA
jgi:quercetin dioxygenase-like cupin family protein